MRSRQQHDMAPLPSPAPSMDSSVLGSSRHTSSLKGKLTTVITVSTRGADQREPPQTITLHIELLANKSPVLAQMARATASEDDFHLTLLDLDAGAFATFADWVYDRPIRFGTEGSEDEDGDILAAVLACDLLARKIQAQDFRNAVMDRACAVSAETGLVFLTPVINRLYASTSARSKLRRWIVDEWVWQFDRDNVDLLKWDEERRLPAEFLFDVVKEQARRLGRKAKKHRSPSEAPEAYHASIPVAAEPAVKHEDGSAVVIEVD